MRILRINLTERKIDEEDIGIETLRSYMGGSGMGAKILFDETSVATNPFGPENILIFVTGVFTGSLVPLSGRHSVISMSLLTSIYGECDIGGSWGAALKRTGYDGIVITGISEEPVYLLLSENKVEIKNAGNLWGMDSYEVDRLIKKEINKRAIVTCIGPSGEKLSRISSIMSNGEHGRAAARCGLGAVMGSKRLKAIVVSGAKKDRRVHHNVKLKESINKILLSVKGKGKMLRV